MHYRPHEKKGCHSRAGGNPKPIGGKRKMQLIMFTYLLYILIIEITANFAGWGKI